MSDLLHHQALDVMLTEATRPARWRSRNDLASQCGIHPTSLSLAASGKRSLSPDSLAALIDCTGWPQDALLLPARARAGDLETARLTAELRRLRDDVNRRTDDIAAAIRERGA